MFEVVHSKSNTASFGEQYSFYIPHHRLTKSPNPLKVTDQSNGLYQMSILDTHQTQDGQATELQFVFKISILKSVNSHKLQNL